MSDPTRPRSPAPDTPLTPHPPRRAQSPRASTDGITDADHSASELRRLASLLDRLPLWVAILSLDGRYEFLNSERFREANPEPELLLGRAIENSFPWMHSPQLAERARDAVQRAARGETVRMEAPSRRSTGELIILDVTFAPFRDEENRIVRVVSVGVDVTHSKQTEESLEQSRKLESLGILAGGVAHDFNNLLAGVMNYSRLALSRIEVAVERQPQLLEESRPGSLGAARRAIEKIRLSAGQMAKLASQMLVFTGLGKLESEQISLSAVAREAADRLTPVALERGCELVCDLAENLPALEADASQLRLVAMNLITNALEACSAVGGSVIVRTTRVVTEVEVVDRIFGDEPLRPGTYVALEVEDAGVGIDSEMLRRLFDPFVTNKESGRGLGLAAVRGIVRAHGGTILVESQPGRGTTFRLMLSPAPSSGTGKQTGTANSDAAREHT